MIYGGRAKALAIVGMVALLGAAVLPDSPVADAAMRGDGAAVRALVDAGADVNAPQGDGMTALHWAAELGDAETVTVLIDADANLEAVTRLGAFTPLHVAAEVGQAATVKLLLEAGANPRAVSTLGGEVPLHYAAQAGSVEAIEALLGRGADPNGRSATGQTPLIFAAERNRPEAITALIRAGADPSLMTVVLDLSGQERHAKAAEAARDSVWATFHEASPDPVTWVPTPAQVQEAMRVARKFEKMEPGFERIDWERYQLEEQKRLSQAQSAGYKGGMTALLFAVREGHFEATEALLAGGADINQQSAGDFTSPLQIAMINGRFDLGLELLSRGADPNMASDAGTTPLFAVINTRWGARPRHPQRMNHLYQKATYLETMELLLEAGADPDARLTKHIWYMAYTSGGGGYLGVDTWGATPFWRAAHGLDVEAMKLLVSYGADWNIPTKAPLRPGVCWRRPCGARGGRRPGRVPHPCSCGIRKLPRRQLPALCAGRLDACGEIHGGGARRRPQPSGLEGVQHQPLRGHAREQRALGLSRRKGGPIPTWLAGTGSRPQIRRTVPGKAVYGSTIPSRC